MQIGNVAGLRGVAGRNPRAKFWCGPTTVASICGIEYQQAVFSMSMYRGSAFVNFTGVGEMQGVFRHRGHEVERHHVIGKPTLAEFMARRGDALRNVPLAVFVTRHVVAVFGDMVCDSQYTRGQLMPIHALRHGQQAKVDAFLIVHPKRTGQ